MICPSCKESQLEPIGTGPKDPDSMVKCWVCGNDWKGWRKEMAWAWKDGYTINPAE